MAIRHARHRKSRLHSHAFHRIGSGSKYLVGWITRAVELLMVIFTLFWAIEANADDFQLPSDFPQADFPQADFPQADFAQEAPDFSFRVPASVQSGQMNLIRRLIPRSWLSVMSSSSVPSPNLGVSKLFNDYITERMKSQAPQIIFTGSTISPTFKQDPLYVPTGLMLFRFKTN